MATDVRKHTAPAGGETPRRQSINDLSLTVHDIPPVANATEQAQFITDLTTAGFGPTSSRPVYVKRLDLDRILSTKDGTTWKAETGSEVYGATPSGASFGGGGGTLGLATTITIASKPWPQRVRLDFAAMPTAIPSGTVEVTLRKDGTGVRAARTATPNVSAGGSLVDDLAAGTSSAYQIVGTASSAAVVTGNGLYTYLTATVTPA